jgi:hypothetical protein
LPRAGSARIERVGLQDGACTISQRNEPLKLLHEIAGGRILRTLSFLSNLLVNGDLAISFLIFTLMLTPRTI